MQKTFFNCIESNLAHFAHQHSDLAEFNLLVSVRCHNGSCVNRPFHNRMSNAGRPDLSNKEGCVRGERDIRALVDVERQSERRADLDQSNAPRDRSNNVSAVILGNNNDRRGGKGSPPLYRNPISSFATRMRSGCSKPDATVVGKPLSPDAKPRRRNNGVRSDRFTFKRRAKGHCALCKKSTKYPGRKISCVKHRQISGKPMSDATTIVVVPQKTLTSKHLDTKSCKDSLRSRCNKPYTVPAPTGQKNCLTQLLLHAAAQICTTVIQSALVAKKCRTRNTDREVTIYDDPRESLYFLDRLESQRAQRHVPYTSAAANMPAVCIDDIYEAANILPRNVFKLSTFNAFMQMFGTRPPRTEKHICIPSFSLLVQAPSLQQQQRPAPSSHITISAATLQLHSDLLGPAFA